ncbi:hypothetical protein Syun_020456 [Stephania yunnanensis]|uniref:Magnesium transporter n=1 Tax=Stephania yunnanensis TaxID=152371 RepID=A0AAP0IDV1_9MAGN
MDDDDDGGSEACAAAGIFDGGSGAHFFFFSTIIHSPKPENYQLAAPPPATTCAHHHRHYHLFKRFVLKMYSSSTQLKLLSGDSAVVNLLGRLNSCCHSYLISSLLANIFRESNPASPATYKIEKTSAVLSVDIPGMQLHLLAFITEPILKMKVVLVVKVQISRVADQAKRRLVTTSEPVKDCYDILFISIVAYPIPALTRITKTYRTSKHPNFVNGGSDSEVEFEGGSPVDTLDSEQSEGSEKIEYLLTDVAETCGFQDMGTSTLEQEAYPALDELTYKICTLNLEHVRQIKSRLVGLFGRVQRVRDELENLLDDDMDMGEMYLTDKLARKLGENDSRNEDVDMENKSDSESESNGMGPSQKSLSLNQISDGITSPSLISNE